MQKATKNIKEGNLDFRLIPDTDDELGQLCQDFEEMRKRLKDNAEEKLAYDKESKELISNNFPRLEDTNHSDQGVCRRNYGWCCRYT